MDWVKSIPSLVRHCAPSSNAVLSTIVCRKTRHINEWLDDEAVNKPFEIVQSLIDGRFIAVLHRPTAEGGWVSMHEDITDRQMSQARVEHTWRFTMASLALVVQL